MPTGHDPTRLFRAPVSPRCSYKLGAHATWSKVKYSAQSSSRRSSSSSPSSSSTRPHVVKFGSHGEVLIAYKSTLEVWDWLPSSLQMLSHVKKKDRMGTSNDTDDQSGRTLYLVASLSVPQGTIEDIEPLEMDQNSNTYKVLIAIRLKSEITFAIRKFGQLYKFDSVFANEEYDDDNVDEDYEDDDDDNASPPVSTRANGAIVDDDPVEKPLILPPFVHGAGPYTIKGSDSFVGVATDEGSLTVFDQVRGHPLPISFDVSVINGKVLFDITGRYLTYVSCNVDSSAPLTKMDVPSHNHSIYSKILQNVSLSAIDGISKLSDINSLKTLVNDKNLTSSLKIYISNLINGFKQSQRVIVMDLQTQKTLASFQPPHGVSNLSLSPFNTHMTTITSRGDQIYKWDITRAPLEVSLLDIQVRGKTGSVVDEIHWTSNDVFQIVTRSSGSIHCFQSDISQNWVLPNLQCQRLCSVKDELFALVGNHELFVIDSKGNNNSKYTLPSSAIPTSLLPDYIRSEPVDEIVERTEPKVKKTPLAEVEIETCFMGQPIFASEKLELATYIYPDNGWDRKVFGGVLEVDRIAFSKGNGQAVFCGEKDELESALSSVLVFDEGL